MTALGTPVSTIGQPDIRGGILREIIGSGAATILVSHSIEQIRELCTKVLWLDKGRQIALGETMEICSRYQDYLDGKLVI